MPPAYSNMADQLGCSRELVLLMAAALSRLKTLRFDVFFCLELAFQQHTPTGLVMALPAVVLQWLSDMSPRQLLSRAELCAKACARAFHAFEDARTLAAQHSRHEVTGLTTSVAAAVYELCISALQKLLAVWRSLAAAEPDTNGQSSSASTTSGNSSSPFPASAQASNSRSKQLMHVQATCHTVVLMLCRAVDAQSIPSSAAAGDVAGCSESAGAAVTASGAASTEHAPAAPADSQQPAVADHCSVLQQFVRQAAASAQDSTQVDAVMMTAFQGVTLSMCSLLATPEVMGSTHMGALVKPVVTAGQLDSPGLLRGGCRQGPLQRSSVLWGMSQR
jgi:hypothetical protein